MRKKILLICSVFFIYFVGLCRVNAKELICEYTNGNREYELINIDSK